MRSIAMLLEQCNSVYQHLCPRQILGIRMGMFAGDLLSIILPQHDTRLLVVAETHGCVSDGISIATNCWVSHGTLRIEDYGKLAATFIDTRDGTAMRLVPRSTLRTDAAAYAPEARSAWEAEILGYQRMAVEDLFSFQAVRVKIPLESFTEQLDKMAVCLLCSEQIVNDREVITDGTVLCRACAGEVYYSVKR